MSCICLWIHFLYVVRHHKTSVITLAKFELQPENTEEQTHEMKGHADLNINITSTLIELHPSFIYQNDRNEMLYLKIYN